MKTLFDTVNLNHLTLKNRLVRSATWEALASPDGSLPDSIFPIYEDLANGGVGLIITGFTSVSDYDIYFDGMMRLSNDTVIPQYQKLTDLVHSHGTPVITQLALGGYYVPDASGHLHERNIDEMTIEEVHHVIQLFTDAAKRAALSGFDGIQIHAAHNFFLSRFISPAYNHRTDLYGGSDENRARILLEILNAVKTASPSLHISMKINSSDFMQGGLDYEDSLIICRLMSESGIDSIEVSGNGTSISGIKPYVNEAYFADFAAALATQIPTPVILVGGLRSIERMNKILKDTQIELLSFSRPLVREPDFPNRLQSGDTRPSACVSCNACYSTPAHRCIFKL